MAEDRDRQWRDEFARRLRQAREEAGLGRVLLSELAGLGPNAVGAYEEGRRYPSVPNLIKLARVLCVQVDFLLGTENF